MENERKLYRNQAVVVQDTESNPGKPCVDFSLGSAHAAAGLLDAATCSLRWSSEWQDKYTHTSSLFLTVRSFGFKYIHICYPEISP